MLHLQSSGEVRHRPAPGQEALVAQLDRASDFDSEGRRFESFRARQHFGLEIKYFGVVLLRSCERFRVAEGRQSVTAKSTTYRLVPNIARNTDATRHFVICSRG